MTSLLSRVQLTRFTQIMIAATMALTIGLATTARANGFRNPPESASAMGKVGARFTDVTDVSAMAFNAANLISIRKPTAAISLNAVYSDVSYASPFGIAETSEPWHFLPNVFAAIPVNEDIVAGLAVTVPYGQGTEWHKDGVFRYAAPYLAEMSVLNIAPNVAFRITDAISLGIGADVYQSSLDFRQVYPWGAVTGDLMDGEGDARFDADGWGVGGHVGLTCRLADKHILAVKYQSAVTVDMDGDFSLGNMPNAAKFPGMLGLIVSPASDFETEVTYPSIIGAGIGTALSDSVTVGIDVEWIEFSQFDELPLNVANNQPLLATPTIRQDWDDTWTVGFGAEWACCSHAVLRCGYLFMESPVPDETLAPSLPEGDQHILSAGMGCGDDVNQLDIGGAVSFNEDRTITNNQNPLFNGEYEVKTSVILSVSYTRQF